MLSLDSLLSCAQEKGMPAAKLRGAAREYLQILALKELYTLGAARALFFLGGTALRFGFNLPRFSEDLDFDAKDMTLVQWRGLLDDLAHALERQGMRLETRAKEKGSLLAGDIRVGGFLQAYDLAANSKEKLQIKIETNRPGYALESETRVISGFGEMFVVPFASTSLMFAEKIMAFLNRSLGRDIYDIFFMTGKKWLPDPGVLAAKGIKGNLSQVISKRLEEFSPSELSQMARRLEPFLFEPSQAAMVADARELMPTSLDYLG